MNVEAIKLIQVTEINLMSVRKYRWEYFKVYCNVAVDLCQSAAAGEWGTPS